MVVILKPIVSMVVGIQGIRLQLQSFVHRDPGSGLPVVPGLAGGGSFGGKNPYKPKKEFAYRMCAGPLTGALPKLNFSCAPAFSCSVWWWCFGGGWLRDVMSSGVM